MFFSLSSHEAPINYRLVNHHRLFSPAWWHRRCWNCTSQTSGGLLSLHINDRGDFLTTPILTARLTRLIAAARKNGASSKPTEAPAENTCAVIVVPEACTQRPNLFSGTVGKKKEHTYRNLHQQETCEKLHLFKFPWYYLFLAIARRARQRGDSKWALYVVHITS